MAGKRGGNKIPHHMVRLNCPIGGKDTPANSTKDKDMYRCCKCGEKHVKNSWTK